MRLYIKYILIIFVLFQTFLCFSQQKVIKGKVSDTKNKPIEGSAIVLYDSQKKIIAYTVTNIEGKYEINSLLKSGYTLEVSHISFFKKQHKISSDIISKSIVEVNFILEENLNSLDEILLFSSKKARDTVKLELDNLNLYKNDNLKEILNKIPNFRLSDNGTIIYKGKNIDKILINKKPSFENQNSIALESIEKEIIKGISVINNYSDDFSLNFDQEQESVLNIDTNNKSQMILSGALEAKYGFKDKFNIKGRGLLFSRTLNAFLTQQTNNIGKTLIKSNEIQKLFGKGQPFSSYQTKSLRKLFSDDENLQKNFLSSTNLTLRNQTKKIKTSGVFYYFTPDRIKRLISTNTTIKGTKLLDRIENINTKTQSFFTALGFAYKISGKTILSYNLNANYTNDFNKSNVENIFFTNKTIGNQNTILSGNANNIFSGFHLLNLKSKIKKNLIFEAKTRVYHEKTDFLNDYFINDNSINTKNKEQDYKFNKNQFSGGLGLQYRVSDALVPFLSLDYYDLKEKIIDKQRFNQSLIQRKRSNYLLNLKVTGRNAIKKGLNYYVSVGVNSFRNSLAQSVNKHNYFIPVSLYLDYDLKMSRYFVNYSRRRSFNSLNSGTDRLVAFNNILKGDSKYPSLFNTSDNFRVSYNYNNIFDAEVFSLDFSFQKQKNIIRKAFVKQVRGVTQYELFIADNSQNFMLEAFYSKTLFALNFPTKIDFSTSYSNSEFPTNFSKKEVKVLNQITTPKISIETITDYFVNFKLSTEFSFSSDNIEESTYNSRYSSSIFSVLFKNTSYKGNISFLYDNNFINNNNFIRKNINLAFEYTKKNITYSIEGRHIGELLNLYQNRSYNSQFTIRDGIASTLINNQSLNYIVLGIKLKL